MLRQIVVAASLLFAGAVCAQDVDDDPFASFDDAFDDFDDGFFEDEQSLSLGGFFEAGFGRRRHASSLIGDRRSLDELRGRLEADYSGDQLRLAVKGDALFDDYADDFDIQLREFSAQLTPAEKVDLKIGRQILTWGTGDLLFLNDLFPKSWVSFFSGRDDEYLKAPSDAVRLTWYAGKINVDVAWTPQFDADEYLDGSRFSFFFPLAGTTVAPNPPLAANPPGSGFDNGEFAVRLFGNAGPTEYAMYLYDGFFKRPLGLTTEFEPTFPKLSVWGASMRRPLAGGLFNAEFAFHDSRDDARGDNPFIPNDQLRVLIGYEFEAATRLNLGLQYYVEATQDYSQLIAASVAPQFEPDRNRHVVTTRLTYRTARDTLTYSLFIFHSPTDDDHYIRPGLTWRHSDQWSVSAGANLFSGERAHTFFGQLEENSNVWVRARFGF